MPLKKILIFGGSGLLGNHASRFFHKKNYEVFSSFNRHKPKDSSVNSIKVDVQNQDELLSILKAIRPEVILNCSGLTSIEECEKEKGKARILHEDFPEFLAKYTSDNNVNNIHISTDHLWDGKKSFYRETEEPNPINTYGWTKAQGEMKVILYNPASLIIRTNFFGKGTEWRESFSDWAIRQLKERKTFFGYEDVYFTPISISFLIEYMSQLMMQTAQGIFHIAGSERLSKYEFIQRIAHVHSLDDSNLEKSKYWIKDSRIDRPLDMSLSTEKVSKHLKRYMPDCHQSVNSLVKDTAEE